MNRYAFSLNNAPRFIDPDGFDADLPVEVPGEVIHIQGEAPPDYEFMMWARRLALWELQAYLISGQPTGRIRDGALPASDAYLTDLRARGVSEYEIDRAWRRLVQLAEDRVANMAWASVPGEKGAKTPWLERELDVVSGSFFGALAYQVGRWLGMSRYKSVQAGELTNNIVDLYSGYKDLTTPFDHPQQGLGQNSAREHGSR